MEVIAHMKLPDTRSYKIHQKNKIIILYDVLQNKLVNTACIRIKGKNSGR